MSASIARQTTAELGGSWSVLAAQKRDHRRLDRLLRMLETSPDETQERLLREVSRLVFPHAFAEESVLWPVIRRAVPDGEDLTRRVEHEHQEVTELVTTLKQGRPGDLGRSQLISRLAAVLRQDVRDEEDELLPKLQDALSAGQLRGVGIAWQLVRRTAPTRPHPVVSRRPPGNVWAALPLTVLDRSRDLLEQGVRRTDGKTAARLRAVSDAAGTAARRVESRHLLRRGEDLSTRRPVTGETE